MQYAGGIEKYVNFSPGHADTVRYSAGFSERLWVPSRNVEACNGMLLGIFNMDASNGPSKNTLLMMFGLPIVTTIIVCASMYVGHVLTKRMDRPTQVVVQPSSPQISVTASPPNVDVHVPAPAVNVMPSTAQVTVIDRPNGAPNNAANGAAQEKEKTEPKLVPLSKPAARSAPVLTPMMVPAQKEPQKTSQIKTEQEDRAADARALKSAPAKPATTTPAPATQGNNARVAVAEIQPRPSPAPVVAPKPAVPEPQAVAAMPARNTQAVQENREARDGRLILASAPAASTSSQYLLGRSVRDEELNLELFYALCRKYADAYCVKKGMDPAVEHNKWQKRWNQNLEQALQDGSDSSEQQYINRQTIAKRDYFNVEKATPEKIAEGCRILLRYREGNLTWLSAMSNALTQENLRKTIDFLNAGPQM